MDSKDKKFSIDEAVKIITDEASKKFVEAIDVAVNLGIDPVKTDQASQRSNESSPRKWKNL